MKNLKIKNVGPIKDVDINLNKINVIIGEQSSGKSTIAKLISFCSWIEKDISYNQSFEKYIENKYFIDKLIDFHKMKGYFRNESEIEYTGDAISIIFKQSKVNINWLSGRYEYKKSKISYIPSERTMITLPEMKKVELPNNYIKSFLHDWLDSEIIYTSEDRLPILNLGIDYFYSETLKDNVISGTDYEISLSQASSGMQSVIPLLAICDNLINHLYTVDQNSSYELDEIRAKVTRQIINEFLMVPMYGSSFDDDNDIRKKKIKELNSKISSGDEDVMVFFENYKKVRQNLFLTHYTNLIIEEPEQNLFPSTQKELAYNLLRMMNLNDEHHLTLTTHSPYVLYAINNCILYSIVEDKLNESEKEKLNLASSKVLSKNISIYEIRNGKLKNIQNKVGLITDNYFDKKMKDVMDEFYVMLNHL